MCELIICPKHLLLHLGWLVWATVSHGQNNLESYLDAARHNSPLINDNRNQVRTNELELQRIKALYTQPQLGVTASYLFAPVISNTNGQSRLELNPNDPGTYSGYDIANSNGGQYQALLNLTQPLFNGKRVETYSEQVRVASQVAQNTGAIAAHDLEKVVTDQYILCLQDQQQLNYVHSMVQILSDQQAMLKKLVDNNIYKQADLILLTIEYQNSLGLRTTYESNYRRDRMDLNILCGMTDTALVTLSELNLIPVNTSGSSAFREKYRLDSLNLVAAQHTFELKYQPQLSLIANTGLNAVYAPTIPNRFGVSAGVNFTYNFYDGHQKKTNREKTAVLMESVAFNQTTFDHQNALRKSKMLAEIATYTERIAIAEAQLANYETLMNTYKREILSGQLSIVNYTTTLKNKATAQRDYALLIAQKQLLINAYNYWNW